MVRIQKLARLSYLWLFGSQSWHTPDISGCLEQIQFGGRKMKNGRTTQFLFSKKQFCCRKTIFGQSTPVFCQKRVCFTGEKLGQANPFFRQKTRCLTERPSSGQKGLMFSRQFQFFCRKMGGGGTTRFRKTSAALCQKNQCVAETTVLWAESSNFCSKNRYLL